MANSFLIWGNTVLVIVFPLVLVSEAEIPLLCTEVVHAKRLLDKCSEMWWCSTDVVAVCCHYEAVCKVCQVIMCRPTLVLYLD